MKNTTLLLSIVTLFALGACKNKKKVIDEQTNVEWADRSLDKKNVDAEQLATYKQLHESHRPDFTTAKMQADVFFSDSSTEQNIQASIQIEKGKRILISLKAFMFTVGKVYITPNRVSYYEMLNNTYYDGDFQMISKILGVELSYNQVENLLLGQTIVAFDQVHQLVTDANKALMIQRIKKHFVLAQFSSSGRLQSEWVSEKNGSQEYLASLQYDRPTDFSGVEIPKMIVLSTKTKKKLHVEIDYQKIKWNEQLKWNYEIPSRYKEVEF